MNARDKCNSTPLHDVRDDKVVKILLDAGAEVNVKEELYGDTPLHRAVENKMKVSGVRALIKAGADMNARNDRNKTPLDLAETKTMINALKKAMEEAAAKKKE